MVMSIGVLRIGELVEKSIRVEIITATGY